MEVDVDVSGMVCPQPAAIVRRCLAELDPGDALVVEGDYPPAERSIRRTCYRHGFRVDDAAMSGEAGTGDGVGPSATEDRFALRITVTEAAADSMAANEDSPEANIE